MVFWNDCSHLLYIMNAMGTFNINRYWQTPNISSELSGILVRQVQHFTYIFVLADF